MIPLRAFISGILIGILGAAIWLTPLGRTTINYLLAKWGISTSRYLTNTPTCPATWQCVTPFPSPLQS